MEGCDGTSYGAPGELTVRRYERMARGGAGLLWFEATAIVPEGRSSPRQLWLNERNVPEHADLLSHLDNVAASIYGGDHRPVTIVQLTHSGRLSRQTGERRPVIAYHHPRRDASYGIPADYPIVTDSELESLEDAYVQAARLAWRAGYQGVDIKSCHGYLLAELLTSRTRPGRYGGSFENRTRLLLNVVTKVRQAVPELLLAVRINGHDGVDYPHSWGIDSEGRVDLAEPIQLVRMLHERGVSVLSVSLGSRRPQYGRTRGASTEDRASRAEHPLESIAHFIAVTREIQRAVPAMAVVGAAYGGLRQYLGHAAAASLRNGWARIVGLGRQGYAYPGFAQDLLNKGALDPRKVCICCNRCVALLQAGAPIGCPVRDAKLYRPLYQEHVGRR